MNRAAIRKIMAFAVVRKEPRFVLVFAGEDVMICHVQDPAERDS